MTPDEFKLEMIHIYGEVPEDEHYNEEKAHILADKVLCQLLCELGYGDGIDVFKQASRWYA